MPKSFPRMLRHLCLPFALSLAGCFGAEPDDSPYTVPRGEAFESLQLELDQDGTPIILAQAGMYMAHKDPAPDNPEENRVWAHNFRSILLRRSEGSWSATNFKNLQPGTGSFPTLIPGPEGRFHAFLSDGEDIKRYVFGNGGWNRVPGTEGLNQIERWGSFGSGNWNRYPRLAVAGADLLLTVHYDWEGYNWVMEGAHRRVELYDSGSLNPLAFHTGPGYRTLAAIGYNFASRMGANSTSKVHLYRWAEGMNRAERQILDDLELGEEAFFARHQGRTALFVRSREKFLTFSLDDSGRVAGRDTLPLPEFALNQYSMIAADSAGCLHGLSYQPGNAGAFVRFAYWNGCVPDAVDTLRVPKPDSTRLYWSGNVNLRIGPDGNPVAALIVRENPPPSDLGVQNRVPPTWLYFAEYRGGSWHLEKVDDRRPP